MGRDTGAGDRAWGVERCANDARSFLRRAGALARAGGGSARVDARAIARSDAVGWERLARSRAGDFEDDDDARLTDAMMRLARVG